MGNLKAQVRCGDDIDPSWFGARGRLGVGRLNENGEHLPTFCALHELCIMNTMFAKIRIYQFAWQHPGTKIWYCIDYVLMRHSQQHYCSDVKVFHSAECWTDYKQVCATLRLHPVFKRWTLCR